MNDRFPEQRTETIRKEIIGLLKSSKQTVGSLSKSVRKTEKEIIGHLEHVSKTEKLTIEPAECIKCGYVFSDRSKIKKPSKCPECKGTYIDEPIFSIK